MSRGEMQEFDPVFNDVMEVFMAADPSDYSDERLLWLPSIVGELYGGQFNVAFGNVTEEDTRYLDQAVRNTEEYCSYPKSQQAVVDANLVLEGTEFHFEGALSVGSVPPLAASTSEATEPLTAEDTADRFFLAWQDGDRATALELASPEWVDSLFSYDPTGYSLDHCEESPSGFLGCVLEPSPESEYPVPFQFNVWLNETGEGYYVSDVYLIGE